MIYAVASGKGGTGKTTVTASLAVLWDQPLMAVDLDVEEPNLHLFLHPALAGETAAMLEVPVPDAERCTLCGQCADFCQYKALSIMGKTLLVFPEMCHGCGGCLALCPEGALSPGRYVGAEDVEEDDEAFADKMARLTKQLGDQMTKGAELDRLIKQKLGGLGYEF